VLDTVMPKTISKWKVHAERIRSGIVKLVEIDQILEKYFSGNFGKMLEELEYICEYFRIPNLRARMEEIERYRRFRADTQVLAVDE